VKTAYKPIDLTASAKTPSTAHPSLILRRASRGGGYIKRQNIPVIFGELLSGGKVKRQKDNELRGGKAITRK
jgi:hypothetical protein